MKWKLEKRTIEELDEYVKNPRTISKKKIEELQTSIERFGQCQPIVINTDNLIIGGHQRLRVLKSLGENEVDVYVPDIALSEKEIEELNIRLNHSSGDWDFDVLANSFETLDLLNWGFEDKDFGVDKNILDLGDAEDPDNPEKKSKSCTMTIKFMREEDLQDAENQISTIVDNYIGASYKIRL